VVEETPIPAEDPDKSTKCLSPCENLSLGVQPSHESSIQGKEVYVVLFSVELHAYCPRTLNWKLDRQLGVKLLGVRFVVTGLLDKQNIDPIPSYIVT